MINIVMLLALLFTVMVLSYRTSPKKYRKLRKLQSANKERQTKIALPNEAPRKAALNIPGYYEDVLNKDKLKKVYKWELHESF